MTEIIEQDFNGCYVEVDTNKITIGDMLDLEEDSSLKRQIQFQAKFCFWKNGMLMTKEDALLWIRTWTMETMKNVGDKIRDGLAKDIKGIDPK